MTIFLDRGPFITIPDAVDPGKYKTIRNPDWEGELPEIVSFTDFLKWNYTAEYGGYIRELHRSKTLPLCYGILPNDEILNVTINDGKYDRLNEFSFLMHVICTVTFDSRGEIFDVRYCVSGRCDIRGKSHFLCEVRLYDGKHIYLSSPLDEYLVPKMTRYSYEIAAERLLMDYYPYDRKRKIDGVLLAKELGCTIMYARLSPTDKIKSKLIFDEKEVVVFDSFGRKTTILVPANTILIDKSIKGSENVYIIHECVHRYLHRLFYSLQSYYRKAVKVRIPEFHDYLMMRNRPDDNDADEEDSEKSRDITRCIHWMEVQANSIAMRILMPADEILDIIGDFYDYHSDGADYDDYRSLIDLVKMRYGVSRYAAKKRMVDLGNNEMRGVYVYCTDGYVNDYEVSSDFPLDHTYTIPLKELVPMLERSEDFKTLVKSNRYIYTDGHVCLNDEKYVHKEHGNAFGLTEYAKHHMHECCIAFKRVYDQPDYKYTYGELNKEALSAIEHYTLSGGEKTAFNKLMDEIIAESKKLEEEETNKPFAEAVKFHMKRCDVIIEDIIARSGLSHGTVCKMRAGKKVRLESVLAFCVALELEEAFRVDLMQKAKVQFDVDIPAHKAYIMILKTFPNANVFQINDLLKDNNLTPWTQERESENIAI